LASAIKPEIYSLKLVAAASDIRMANTDCSTGFWWDYERIYRTVKKNYKLSFYGNH